jgi:Cytochrome c
MARCHHFDKIVIIWRFSTYALQSFENRMKTCVAVILLLLLNCIGCQKGDPKKGEILFRTYGCAHCHTASAEKRLAPDLAQVGSRYDAARLEKWLLDPEIIYKELGKRPVNPGYPPMPRITLTEKEIYDLVSYLKTIQ